MAEGKKTILIADDEEDIVELLRYNLENEGFEVITAYNGKKAVELAENQSPDLIILDVMMPEMSGFEASQALKSNPETQNIPFVFLTARGEEENEVYGLNLGADDYIQKPIKPKLLLTRINTVFRRIKKEEKEILNFDNFSIDKTKHQVTIDGKPIKLAKKEFKLLYLLASRPGKVFLRDEIMIKVWGNDVIVGDRTIDVHIRKIRSKMGIKCIETVKGVGYKFEYSS